MYKLVYLPPKSPSESVRISKNGDGIEKRKRIRNFVTRQGSLSFIKRLTISMQMLPFEKG